MQRWKAMSGTERGPNKMLFSTEFITHRRTAAALTSPGGSCLKPHRSLSFVQTLRSGRHLRSCRQVYESRHRVTSRRFVFGFSAWVLKVGRDLAPLFPTRLISRHSSDLSTMEVSTFVPIPSYLSRLSWEVRLPPSRFRRAGAIATWRAARPERRIWSQANAAAA
jgi:hypothetical protein